MSAHVQQLRDDDPDALTILNTVMNALMLVASFAVIAQQASKNRREKSAASGVARDAMVKHLGQMEELVSALSYDLDSLEKLISRSPVIQGRGFQKQALGTMALSLDERDFNTFVETHKSAAQRTLQLMDNVYPAIRLLQRVDLQLGSEAKRHLVTLSTRVDTYVSRGSSFGEGMNNAREVIGVARNLMSEMRKEIRNSPYFDDGFSPK